MILSITCFREEFCYAGNFQSPVGTSQELSQGLPQIIPVLGLSCLRSPGRSRRPAPAWAAFCTWGGRTPWPPGRGTRWRGTCRSTAGAGGGRLTKRERQREGGRSKSASHLFLSSLLWAKNARQLFLSSLLMLWH